ncbi:MAG TPA: hypothetical protein VHC95_07135 [Opitutales bacterium]|nr:hypothetical protein [Opitutales bacterium]
MTPIQQAVKAYESLGRNFAEDHGAYLEFGYVVSTPNWFVMARPVNLAQPARWLTVDDLNSTFPNCPEAEAWYVQFACGRGALRRFMQHLPFWLPKICWKRSLKKPHSPLRIYRLDRLAGLIS